MNPHPPLAGFPIVLTFLLFAAEVFALLGAARACRIFAAVILKILCLIAPLTYYSGYWGAEHANQTFTVSPEIIADHQGWAQLFLISLIPCLLLSLLESSAQSSNDCETRKKSGLYYAYLFFVLVSFSLAAFTSYHGGGLVFEHGAGVRATPNTLITEQIK